METRLWIYPLMSLMVLVGFGCGDEGEVQSTTAALGSSGIAASPVAEGSLAEGALGIDAAEAVIVADIVEILNLLLNPSQKVLDAIVIEQDGKKIIETDQKKEILQQFIVTLSDVLLSDPGAQPLDVNITVNNGTWEEKVDIVGDEAKVEMEISGKVHAESIWSIDNARFELIPSVDTRIELTLDDFGGDEGELLIQAPDLASRIVAVINSLLESSILDAIVVEENGLKIVGTDQKKEILQAMVRFVYEVTVATTTAFLRVNDGKTWEERVELVGDEAKVEMEISGKVFDESRWVIDEVDIVMSTDTVTLGSTSDTND